tara:strand:- start:6 stop:494 length:489 start_codon:yes stop_codon:yes gene_type:complete
LEQKEYRPNVAVIIVNLSGKVLWCQRKQHDGWQFPQGGIDKGETPVEAALRETKEEVGLGEHDIEIVYESQQWFKYKVPKEKRTGYFTKKIFFGQKQKWFLARLLSDENKIDLNAYRPIEFDKWVWANYWHPINAVVSFKKETYRQALLSILPEYNKLTKKL